MRAPSSTSTWIDRLGLASGARRRRGVLAAFVVAGIAIAGLSGAQAPQMDHLGSTSPATAIPGARSSSPMTAAELEAALRRYDAEERRLTAELEAIDLELERLGARVVSRGRAHYRNIHAGLLPAGGGFDQLVDHAARVERNRTALVRDLERETILRNRRRELGDQLSRVKGERAPLEVHRETILRAQAMVRAADERRAAYERAFETSTSPSDYVAIYGADTGPSDGPSAGSSAGFASLKGHLPFPVAGRAEVRRLEREGALPAIELRAPAGAMARAVAPGRVAFADRHATSSQGDELVTVILDHGDRFFTVYGNLERADVRLGESIPAQAALGPVATRKHEGAVLYFELRKQGRTVDPGPWLGL
jgi:murein DD-endopeptidase MepM/ murein hydrolase activator NlpD